MDAELVHILEYVRKSERTCMEAGEAIRKDLADGSPLEKLPEAFIEFAEEVAKTFGRIETALTDLFNRIEPGEN